MLQVAAMNSNIPNNWKRPWTDEQPKIPSITLPNPAKSLFARDGHDSEQASRRPSITQDLHNVDPEDRLLHAMPASSASDPYTQYLLAQDSPANSAKRMRMSASPWYDLKGNGPSSTFGPGPGPEKETPRRVSSPRSGQTSRQTSAAPAWAPIADEATRPSDMSTLYAKIRSRQQATNCDDCNKAQHVAPHIAQGLQDMNSQLKSIVIPRRRSAERIHEVNEASKPVPENLLDTLDYSMDKVNDNMRLLKEMMSILNIEDDRQLPGQRNRTEEERHLSRASNSMSPPGNDGVRRGSSRSGSQERFVPDLLSRSPPSRHLPSPNPPHFSTFGTSGFSPKPTATGTFTGQLHELQQKLSAKTTSQQALEAENAKLHAMYSQAQAGYTSLAERCSVTDSELNILTEDRNILQGQVESLEKQVTELQCSRTEAQTESAASASQYLKIMAMSSKLQAQGAIDLKKYKSDRDAWATQKAEFEQRIKDLEQAHGTASIFVATLAAASGKTAEEQNVMDDAELANMSFDKLKEEIITLRKNVREASAFIQSIRDEGSTIARLTEELGAAGQRLVQLGVVSIPPAQED